jgi:hypothetical protein
MNKESYFNTNQENGEVLKESRNSANRQENLIYAFFQKNFREAFSPEDIYLKVYNESVVPLTSVRRAITNLTKKGKLFKTNIQVQGMYGKKISLWKLQ